MACSQYEYVKKFESHESLLPNTYIVVRIDGKGFTKFTASHGFVKPNDKRGLDLMNKAAASVMETFTEIVLAYGQSDEFSFVFSRAAEVYQRRTEKIVSCLVSCFTASYAMHFRSFFGSDPTSLPMFDARAVCYPTWKNLRDYLCWRQVDCHINNLYNTCFWTMVEKGGMTPQAAQTALKVTLSDRKNEILFTDYGINYAKLDPQFRKGSTLIRVLVLKDKHAKNDQGQEEEVAKQIEEGVESLTVTKVEEVVQQNNEEEKQKEEEEKDDKKNKKGEKQNAPKKEKKLSKNKQDKIEKAKFRQVITTVYDDIIQEEFWQNYKESLVALLD